MLTKVKDPSPINSRTGAVYKIPCAECLASYVGETGRTLECRIKEHKRSIVNEDTGNNIAVHHMSTKHQMNPPFSRLTDGGNTCSKLETVGQATIVREAEAILPTFSRDKSILLLINCLLDA